MARQGPHQDAEKSTTTSRDEPADGKRMDGRSPCTLRMM